MAREGGSPGQGGRHGGEGDQGEQGQPAVGEGVGVDQQIGAEGDQQQGHQAGAMAAQHRLPMELL
jgi:hypothetical protein